MQTLALRGPATSDAVRNARSRFEALLSEGRRNTASVLDRIDREQPLDRVVRAGALRFEPAAHGASKIALRIGADASAVVEPLAPFALGQATSKAGVPKTFVDDLLDPARSGWGPELLAHNLNELNAREAADTRLLLRSVNGQVRGYLSDRYRRMDARPIIGAFIEACRSVGALPLRGHVTETRVAIKMVLDRVFEPLPGGYEMMVLGAALTTSDFGAAPLVVSFYCERLVCLNGLIAEQGLRAVHLGARLADDVSFSQRTYELDTATQASAVRDLVRARLNAENIERFQGAIRAAHAAELAPGRITEFLGRALSKGDRQQVLDAYQSPDVVMMPPGNTAYRLAQSLGYVANKVDDDDRRLALQKLAGEAMQLGRAA